MPASRSQPGYTNIKDDVQRRLRRIEGQVRGLQRMVDEDGVLHRRADPGVGRDEGTPGRRARVARRPPRALRGRRDRRRAGPRRRRRSPRRPRPWRVSSGRERAAIPVTHVVAFLSTRRRSFGARRSSCSGRRCGRWFSASGCRARCRRSSRRTRCNGCSATTARRGRAGVGLRDGLVVLLVRGVGDGEVAVPEGRRLRRRRWCSCSRRRTSWSSSASCWWC